MIYIGAYFLFYLIVAVWVIVDSRPRQSSGLSWGGAALIVGPVAAPLYLAKRTLKPGEVRAGGMPWNFAKYFALFWTSTVAVVFLADCIDFATSKSAYPPSSSDHAAAGVAFFLAVVLYFVVWLIPVAVSLTTGFLLKKPSIVEQGSAVETSRSNHKVPASIAKAPSRTNEPVAVRSNLPEAIYLTRDGLQYGPYTVDQIKDAVREGTVKPDDYAWYDGAPDWLPLSAFLTTSES